MLITCLYENSGFGKLRYKNVRSEKQSLLNLKGYWRYKKSKIYTKYIVFTYPSITLVRLHHNQISEKDFSIEF